MKSPKKSHTHKNCNFKSIIGRFSTNCFYHRNFMAVKCMYFFIFASCEPLKHFNVGKALYSINSGNTIHNGFKVGKVKVSQNMQKSQIPQNVTISGLCSKPSIFSMFDIVCYFEWLFSQRQIKSNSKNERFCKSKNTLLYLHLRLEMKISELKSTTLIRVVSELSPAGVWQKQPFLQTHWKKFMFRLLIELHVVNQLNMT